MVLPVTHPYLRDRGPGTLLPPVEEPLGDEVGDRTGHRHGPEQQPEEEPLGELDLVPHKEIHCRHEHHCPENEGHETEERRLWGAPMSSHRHHSLANMP